MRRRMGRPTMPSKTIIPLPLPRTAGSLADPALVPAQPFEHLDALWIQVAGTLCNLRCAHCFVSSGPGDDHHALMSRDLVRRRVAEGVSLGVKEFYFTGGEPFIHPAMLEIVADTLVHGPVTVLTNGTLFTVPRALALRRLADGSRYSLEIRVSLDGWRAADHDLLRGPGSFERALEGIRRLVAVGLLPIVTATQGADQEPERLRARYLEMLRGQGVERPRLKLLPMFQLGREAERSRGYDPDESLAGLPAAAFDPHRLQ